MARSGVMPTPPASSTTPRPVRPAVNAPYGPSAMTRVPGRSRDKARLWSPMSFTVIRMRSLPGAADSEYGCDDHHSDLVRNRQRKNCPGSAASSSRCAPPM